MQNLTVFFIRGELPPFEGFPSGADCRVTANGVRGAQPPLGARFVSTTIKVYKEQASVRI